MNKSIQVVADVLRGLHHYGDRRSGRTTLMVNAIKNMAHSAPRIQSRILATNERHARFLRTQMSQGETDSTRWTVLSVDSFSDNGLRGFDGMVFIDHFTLERAFLDLVTENEILKKRLEVFHNGFHEFYSAVSESKAPSANRQVPEFPPNRIWMNK